MSSFVRFGISAMVIVALLAWMAQSAGHWVLLQGGLTILIVAVPVWVAIAYVSALRSAHARAVLLRPVWWGGFLSGHLFRLVAAVPAALLAGAGVMAALIADGSRALLWIGAAAVLVLVVSIGVNRVVAADLRPYARLRPTIYIVTSVTAFILTLCLAALSAQPPAGDLRDMMMSQPRYTGSSLLIEQWTDTLALWSGAKAWAEAQAEAVGLHFAVIIWRLVSSFGYFAGVALVFAACLIPLREMRRILRPTDADDPARVEPRQAALFSAICVIALSTGLQTLVRFEQAALPAVSVQTEGPELAQAGAGASPQLATVSPDSTPPAMIADLLLPSDLRRSVEVDQIGELVCPRGTIVQVAALDADLAAVIARQKADVAAAVEVGFDRMRANVPVFLDWYYSLGAEYLRTLNILIGNGGTYLNDQLQDRLGTDDPLAELRTAIQALEAGAILADIYQQNRRSLLAGCTNLPSDMFTLDAVNTRPAEFLTIALHEDAIRLEARLTSAGLSGVIGAGMAGVLVGKVIAKVSLGSAFKAAAAALVKMAGSKGLSIGGGVLIGGGTGAAGGSVVPGLGTVAGGVIGGIAGGVAVWIGVDYAMLRLEEEISRDAFEADILAAIAQTEAEIMAVLDDRP